MDSLLTIYLILICAGEKKAKTFDLTAMLEQAKQTARARSQKTFGKLNTTRLLSKTYL